MTTRNDRAAGLANLDFPAEGVVLVRPHFGRGSGAIVVAGQVVKEPLLGQTAMGVVKRLIDGGSAFYGEGYC